MNRDQALSILELAPGASLESAEQAFATQYRELTALLQSVGLQPRAREQLQSSLAALEGAIACLRSGPGESLDDPEATVVSGARVESRRLDRTEPLSPERLRGDETLPGFADRPGSESEDDAELTARPSGRPGSESEEAAELTARPSTSRGAVRPGRRDWSGRHFPYPLSWLIAGLLAVAAAGGLAFLLLSGGDAPEEPPVATEVVETPPSAGLPEVVDEMEQLQGEWQIAGDRLQDQQLELASILDKARSDARSGSANSDPGYLPEQQSPPDRERLRLIEQHIVDDDYLLTLGRALARPFPRDQARDVVRRALRELSQLTGDAGARRAQLVKLDEALAARRTMRSQLARLREEGLAEWPPEASDVPLLFQEAAPLDIERIQDARTRAGELLADGRFSLAADGYRRTGAALAGLQLIEEIPDTGDEERIAELFALGKQAIARNRLSRPADGSALYFALEIETLEAGRPEAAELMAGIQRRYIALAHNQLSRGDERKARRYANMAVAMGADAGEVEAIHAAASANVEKQFQPGQPVEEVEGLAMVTLPLGTYTMGAKSSALKEFADGIGSFFGAFFRDEGDRDYTGRETEVPPHPVSIDTWVALSRSEISVAQFRRFVQNTDYLTDAEIQGYSYAHVNDREERVENRNWRHDYRGEPAAPELPVTYVSYRDASAYAKWLASLTGASYRLPSESEFEYAARAGQLELTPWGRGAPPAGAGNFRGEEDPIPEDWRSARGGDEVREVKDYGDGAFGPFPVGTADPNEFGLESLLGNVAEWTEDCHHLDYEGKGSEQGPRPGGDCEQRMVRGTDWASDARLLRLSYREARPQHYSSSTLGFRVAREVLR